MANLPLEIIELIISHISAHEDLYTCLFINKYFYRATLPVLWHSPKSVLSNGKTVYLRYRHVYQCGTSSDSLGFFGVSNRHHIRRLSFNGAVAMFEITQFLPLIPLLTELVLDYVRTNDKKMDVVARRCRHLQRITLRSLRWVSPKTIVSLARHCPRLTGISLSDCPNISANALLPLLESNGLDQLTVGGGSLFETKEDASKSDFEKIFINVLSSYMSTSMTKPLTELYNPSFILEWAGLIRSINNEWALRLTELCLYDIDDETLLIPLLETHTRLESLTLTLCHLGLKTLTAIARSLFKLRQLDLSGSHGFSSVNLKNMVKLGCPNLGLLVLVDCQRASKDFAMTGPVDRLHRADLGRLRWEPDIPPRLRVSRIPRPLRPLHTTQA
ncbi:hypothetical protein [Absidia glauca]|uniref:F-box domain-containing protein n=1 Tax=Absidia glauca TaxID=4829 RepID=A0A163JUM2_ABSGL|nr:hypothetical protein [Absidia glauca]